MLSAPLRSVTARRSIAVALLALAIPAVAPLCAQAFTLPGTLVGKPLFDSPYFGVPPTGTVGDVTFPYDVFSFRVNTTGQYGFNATSAFPNALYLYRNAFDPASPLSNILFGITSYTGPVDPSDGPLLPGPIQFGLNTTDRYFLVTSSYFDDEAGPYVASISCPAGSCLGKISPTPIMTEVPEPSSVLLVATGLAMGAMVHRRRRTR